MTAENSPDRETVDLAQKQSSPRRFPIWPWIIAAVLAPILWDFWPHLAANYRAERVRAVCAAGRSWSDAERDLQKIPNIEFSDNNEKYKFVILAPRWSYLYQSYARTASKFNRAYANRIMEALAGHSGFTVELDESGKIVRGFRISGP